MERQIKLDKKEKHYETIRKKYNYNIMVRTTLSDDEMRETMHRVLDFYFNRTHYIHASFIEHFRLFELTDADSIFLMNYYMVLNRAHNPNRLQQIDEWLSQRRANMEINPRQSNRGQTRGRRNRRGSSQRATRSRNRSRPPSPAISRINSRRRQPVK